MRGLRVCFCLSLLAALPAGVVMAAPVEGQGVVRRFDIPRRPLAQALSEFASQTGLQMLYDAPLAVGHQSTALSGDDESAFGAGADAAGNGAVGAFHKCWRRGDLCRHHVDSNFEPSDSRCIARGGTRSRRSRIHHLRRRRSTHFDGSAACGRCPDGCRLSLKHPIVGDREWRSGSSGNTDRFGRRRARSAICQTNHGDDVAAAARPTAAADADRIFGAAT